MMIWRETREPKRRTTRGDADERAASRAEEGGADSLVGVRAAERAAPTSITRLASTTRATTASASVPPAQPHSAYARGRERTTEPTAVMVRLSVDDASADQGVDLSSSSSSSSSGADSSSSSRNELVREKADEPSSDATPRRAREARDAPQDTIRARVRGRDGAVRYPAARGGGSGDAGSRDARHARLRGARRWRETLSREDSQSREPNRARSADGADATRRAPGTRDNVFPRGVRFVFLLRARTRHTTSSRRAARGRPRRASSTRRLVGRRSSRVVSASRPARPARTLVGRPPVPPRRREENCKMVVTARFVLTGLVRRRREPARSRRARVVREPRPRRARRARRAPSSRK